MDVNADVNANANVKVAANVMQGYVMLCYVMLCIINGYIWLLIMVNGY